MPSTPAERRALLFLAGVALLGSVVRVARSAAAREPVPPAAERALAAQRAALDQAARERAQPPARAKGRRKGATPPAAARPSPRTRAGRRAPAAAPVVGPVDVDRATAAELERLPRIGPALARRIVADRDSLGAFGSMEALRTVKGIGPAVAAALAPHVTFSGNPRPIRVERAATDRRP